MVKTDDFLTLKGDWLTLLGRSDFLLLFTEENFCTWDSPENNI